MYDSIYITVHLDVLYSNISYHLIQLLQSDFLILQMEVTQALKRSLVGPNEVTT